MSLESAILGFLNYHPHSGYDLKKNFDNSVRHFWPADQSQIYRTLSRLTEKEYVKMKKKPQEDRPDRKIYHITRAGRAALRHWLAGPPPKEDPRSASLIQVFFSAQLSDKEVLAKLKAAADGYRAALAKYEQIPNQWGPYQREIHSSREHFFWKLTLENGIHTMHANLEWIENVIKRMESGRIPR
jgi:DNA-binding PadR family transcriptional regulator